MYQIEIDHLCKSYGAVKILKDISLNVEKGSFVTLIGPSGCGKSTLLRLVAGLEKITSGTVKIAGEVVNDRPPRERHVAMVFQSYALYPHMTVSKNLTYALRLRGRPKQEIDERAAATGQLLGLSDLLDRMPRDLSGGQRQRVAMGRAIVRDPQVFLFDEPLSNLDAALRVRMRSELRKLHQRLGATSLYVTHDQIEAMTMADTVVVLRDGVVEQVGAPLDLYHRPANRFVAGFIGSPAMNFVEGIVTEDGRGVVLSQARKQRLELPRPLQSGRKVWIGLRPEHMQLGGAGKKQKFDVQVDTVESTGSMTFIETKADPTSLIIAQSGTAQVAGGTTITVGINSEDIYLFDIKTELAV